MSSSRVTRKVTVEGSKRLSEVNPSHRSRPSVFERLGPGSIELRPQRGSYYQTEKCRNWLTDGDCPYGNKCRFQHGPFTSSRKGIRSVVRSDKKDRSEEREDYEGGEDEEEMDEEEHRYHKPARMTSESPPKKRKHKKKHADVEEENEGERKDVSHKEKKKHKRKHSKTLEHEWAEEQDDKTGKDMDWEEKAELERRRKELQRQLAEIDKESADTHKKPRDRSEERPVPVVHSKLRRSPTEEADVPVPVPLEKKKRKVEITKSRVDLGEGLGPSEDIITENKKHRIKSEKYEGKRASLSEESIEGDSHKTTPKKKVLGFEQKSKPVFEDKEITAKEAEVIVKKIKKKKQHYETPSPDQGREVKKITPASGPYEHLLEELSDDEMVGPKVHHMKPKHYEEERQGRKPSRKSKTESDLKLGHRKGRSLSSEPPPPRGPQTPPLMEFDSSEQSWSPLPQHKPVKGPHTPPDLEPDNDNETPVEDNVPLPHEEIRKSRREVEQSNRTVEGSFPGRDTPHEEKERRKEQAPFTPPIHAEGRERRRERDGHTPPPEEEMFERHERVGREKQRRDPDREQSRHRGPGDEYRERGRDVFETSAQERYHKREGELEGRRRSDRVREDEYESGQERKRDTQPPARDHDRKRNRSFSPSARHRGPPLPDSRRPQEREHYDSRERYEGMKYQYDSNRGRDRRPGFSPQRGGARGYNMRGARGRGSYNMSRDNQGWQNDDRQRYPGRDQYHSRSDRGGRGIRGHTDEQRYTGPGQTDRHSDWGSRGERPYPEREHRRHADGSRSPERREARDNKVPEKHKRHPGDNDWDDRKGSPLKEAVFDAEGPAPRRERDGTRGHARSSEDDWDYEEDVRQPEAERQNRKRPKEDRPGEMSPVPAKKSRKYVAAHSPDEPHKPNDGETKEPVVVEGETVKPPVEGVEKVKKKKIKPEEKLKNISSGDGITEAGPELENLDVKPDSEKLVKKHKKDKSKKVKGEKKKKKKSVEGMKTDTTTEDSVTTEASPAHQGGVKVGKKRKIPEGGVVEEASKVKKKKKKKHQPEVIVRPWSDLEGEEEQEIGGETKTGTHEGKGVKDDGLETDGLLIKENQDAGKTEEVFSDWSSDDNPEAFDVWEDEEGVKEVENSVPQSAVVGQDGPSVGQDGASFDDVYDPISDDELEQILDDDEEANAASWDNKPSVVEVDWSVLAKSTSTDKKGDAEPGAHLKKFTPGAIFSRIGISPALAGPELLKRVQNKCAQEAKAIGGSNEEVPLQKIESRLGGLVAAAEARKKERGNLVTNIGPCRRALCARRDLAMRKQLRKFSTKFGTKLSVFACAPTTPVENNLFMLSLQLYRRPCENSSSDYKLVSSSVGSVLVST